MICLSGLSFEAVETHGGNDTRNKRATPPPTPTKKSPESKVPKCGVSGQEQSQALVPKMPERAAVTPVPEERPLTPEATGAMQDKELLVLAMNRIAALETLVKQQAAQAEFKTPSPKVPGSSASKSSTTADGRSQGIASETETPGNGQDEGDEEGEGGDGDMICMPGGAQATWPSCLKSQLVNL